MELTVIMCVLSLSSSYYMAEDYYIIGSIIYSQCGQLRFVTTFEP